MSLLDWAGRVVKTLLESAGTESVMRARLVADAPLPIAVVRSGSHEVLLASVRWVALFGESAHAPLALRGALEHADATNTAVSVAELVFHRDDDPTAIQRACRVAVQPVRLGERDRGLVAACTEITDDALARRLRVGPSALIWSGRGREADYCNAQLAGYVGRELAPGATMDWRTHVFADDLARCEQALAEATARRTIVEREARLRRADGAYRWHQVRFSCEAPARWYATAGDVEETHYAQEQRIALLDRLLAALNEAESANRAKDNFLATVSHELRAPVTTIMLWEKVLRDHLDDIPMRARALDAIRDSAAAQSRLVGDLLDISRAISGKLRIERRRMPIDSVLSAAVEAAVPAATAKQIRISLQIRPRLGRVLADPARLRQVFDNLLSNAVKFTPAGGSIHVVASRDRGHVNVAIADTGRGMESHFLRRLFTPFVQNEEVLTRSEGGLGLGLAIAKQLVGLHEGTLTAESPGPGKGSTFTVSLPLAHRRSSTPVPRTPEPTPRRLDRVRVLVVDDEPRVREALKLLLSRSGAVVDLATSAEEARGLMAGARPDVLICDISMPGEDGYTFLRGLRASGGAACDVPAIALTAYASQRDRERAAAAGFDAHLAKPVQLHVLSAAIDHVLAGRRSQSEQKH